MRRRLTDRMLRAIEGACDAASAGEEDAGDLEGTGITHEDLHNASYWAAEELARRATRRDRAAAARAASGRRSSATAPG